MRIDKAKIRPPIIREKNLPNQRVSTYTESYKGEYYNIEVSKLVPFKNQSRKIFDPKDLEDLAKTIKLHGIRQPLTVLPLEEAEGGYEIISGERRWRAAKSIGLTKVPCIILQDRNAAEEVALIENVQRKNLHPLELMKGFQSLLEKGICKNQGEIADKIGVTRTLVVETLALNKLPESTQELLLRHNVKSRDILRKILKAPQKEHEKIIEGANQLKQASKKNRISSVNRKKHKIISIYLESENLTFNEEKIVLTLEQKDKLIEYLKQFINRL